MTTEDFEKRKKEILSELVKSENETLDNLKNLVTKTKPFFFIEGGTGKVILSRDIGLKIADRILLLLIGKYFAFNLDILTEKSLDINKISEELGGIPKTTLSKPLGILVNKNLIRKPAEDGLYEITHYFIEDILNDMWKKYKPKGE